MNSNGPASTTVAPPPPPSPPQQQTSNYKQDKYLALAFAHKHPDEIDWNCAGMPVVFTAPASLRRTTTPNRLPQYRLPHNAYEAYHLHEPLGSDEIVAEHNNGNEPLLPLRIASYDAEYVQFHSTLIVPVNTVRKNKFGQSAFTFVFVQKWCAEIIKAHREFLSREYVVLYPEVCSFERDENDIQFMRVEALGAILSPHSEPPKPSNVDADESCLYSGMTGVGAPFYFGDESTYLKLRRPIATDRCAPNYRHTGWCGVDGDLCAACIMEPPLDNAANNNKKRHRDD